MRPKRGLLIALVLLLGALPRAAFARDYSPQEEEKLGKEGCAQIEKEYKVIEDAAQLKRVHQILSALAPVTSRPEVTYRAKILDTEDVNALSLPGGFIYVTKGLLDIVESDDELAGVLAHEIAHNAHRHAIQSLQQSSKLDQKLVLMFLAGLLLQREGVDLGQVALLGVLLKTNALNGYGRKAEMEADRSAVEYLAASKRYNPNGILQFMETLQREEMRRPQVELGIFQTHPHTRERIEAIRTALSELKIPIVRIPGKSTPKATSRPATVNGVEIAEVVVKERVVFQPAAHAGKSPAERAEATVARINAMFLQFPEERHIRVKTEGESAVVLFRNEPLITITPEDGQLHGTTPSELAENAAKTLKSVIWEDFVRRAY